MVKKIIQDVVKIEAEEVTIKIRGKKSCQKLENNEFEQ